MKPQYLLFLSLVYCGGDLVCGEGTHEENGVCVPGEEETDIDTDTDEDDGSHPLPPDQYKWIWNTEGTCETWNNRTGNQVYIYATDVRITAEGALSGTEKWYWFWEGEGWEGDCVDTFEVTGTTTAIDFEQYRCSQCEESYEISRKLIDSQCGHSYDRHLISYDWSDGWKDPGEIDAYPALAMFDTLTPNGNVNEDNKMLFVHLKADAEGELNPDSVDGDFAVGHAIPDDAEQVGVPGTYDWLAEKCLRTSW
jgi:hypothetical protein